MEISGWACSTRCTREAEPAALPIAWVRFSSAAASAVTVRAVFAAWAAVAEKEQLTAEEESVSARL